MSQQQAVQPIVLKQENGEVVLKLVLENPKQETQTLILQQPDGKEFTMSTDTTAIAAFDYATGIAVFLALCATGLAYWFGVRSFALTKQSFDALVKQIESSEKSAFDLNAKLFLQQKELQKNELELKETIEWNNLVFELAAEATVLINQFIFKAVEFSRYYLNASSNEKTQPLYISCQKLNELENLHLELILNIAKLDTFLKMENYNHEYIIKLLDYFSVIAKDLIGEFYNKSRVEKFEVFKDLSNIEYGDGKILNLENWQNDVLKNRLEILSLIMREISTNFKTKLRKAT